MHGREKQISPTILIETSIERMTKVVRRILAIPLSGHTFKPRHFQKRGIDLRAMSWILSISAPPLWLMA
jgi:hypothetical protein